MSTLEVKVRSDFQIIAHPNADRLELVQLGGEGGYLSVIGKGQFKPGDHLIYVPVDAVIPEEMSVKLTANSKVKIGPRIRAAKIRGVTSQGLCLRPEEWLNGNPWKDGSDVADVLGIKKFQPPEPIFKGGTTKGVSIAYQNENFEKYTEVENFAKFPRIFDNAVKGLDVVATLKYHGTNFRAGIVRKPYRKYGPALRFLRKIAAALGFSVSEFEFLVGSHNVIRKVSLTVGSQNIEDLYWKVANKYQIRKIAEQFLSKHPEHSEVIVYGEVIGPGIQKGYDYGHDDHKLVVFDVKVDGVYLNWDEVVEFVETYGLFHVQVVGRGPFTLDMLKLAEAVDDYNGKKHIREGIVIKPVVESRDLMLGRVILKAINPTYLTDTTNSDFH